MDRSGAATDLENGSMSVAARLSLTLSGMHLTIMTTNNPNPYRSPVTDGKRNGRTRQLRTMRSRVVSFFVYSVLSFCFIYSAGSWYYTHKLYRERPAGANYMTVGEMAEQEFRAKHPFVLFLSPVIIGGARAALPR